MSKLDQDFYSENYLKAVKAYVVSDLTKLNEYLLKTENSVERKLLEIRVFMEKNQKDKALSLCQSLDISNPAYRAEKYFLTSTLLYSKRHYEASIEAALCALNAYEMIGLSSKVFLTALNTAMGYAELRLYSLSEYYLNIARSHMKCLNQELLYWRYMACLSSQKGDYKKSKEFLSRIEKQMDQDPVFDRETFYLVAGGICAWHRDYEPALNYFSKIKKGSHLLIRERLKSFDAFIRKILLKVNPEKIGAPPQWFTRDSEPFLQWQVLHFIETGELSSLTKAWDKLKLKRPLVYMDEVLKLSGDERNSIFSQCLSRLQLSHSYEQNTSQISGKLAQALELFIQSKTPLRKEELIEKIWGTQYDPSFDARFYKLMERMKSHSKLKIIQKNRAYFLQA